MTRSTSSPTSWDWSLIWRTSLSPTSGYWISFSAWACWLADSLPRSAVRERCMSEMTPCWICWCRKFSATSLWKPCSGLINNILPILLHRMEVRKLQCRNLEYQSTQRYVTKRPLYNNISTAYLVDIRPTYFRFLTWLFCIRLPCNIAITIFIRLEARP